MTLSLILTAIGLAMPAQAEMPQNPYVRPDASTDISQMADISRQVGRNLGDIPPEVVRIAAYQFKADPREFTPGMLRHIQARIEEAIRNNGKTVINSPELRTLRVISTDSTFHVSNAAPNQEELWKLAEKLRVDGFLEGTCTRSSEGDLLVSLKIFKAKGGDVVWSGNFVAGPNKSDNSFLDLDYAISCPMSLFNVGTYQADSATKYSNAFLASDLSLDFSVTEAVTQDKRILFTVYGGYSHHSMWGLPDSVQSSPGVHALRLGVELTGVFFRKANPDQGYWLGTYIGYRSLMPFLYRDNLSGITLGYRSKLSKHFSMSIGAVVYPFGSDFIETYASDPQILKTSALSLEATLLHYTF